LLILESLLCLPRIVAGLARVLRLRRQAGDGPQTEAEQRQAKSDDGACTRASPYIYGEEPMLLRGTASHLIFNSFLWLMDD
jgi:hypothetical protein